MENPGIALILVGLVAALGAAFAWFADDRRHHRRDLDRAGFMPWTKVFFLALMTALLCLGIGVKIWLAG